MKKVRKKHNFWYKWNKQNIICWYALEVLLPAVSPCFLVFMLSYANWLLVVVSHLLYRHGSGFQLSARTQRKVFPKIDNYCFENYCFIECNRSFGDNDWNYAFSNLWLGLMYTLYGLQWIHKLNPICEADLHEQSRAEVSHEM